MTIQTAEKLNRLERLLPEGLLVDASWLEEHGYSRALRSQYVSSGWLSSPVRGVYWRPRGRLRWEQVVISLQVLLRHPVSVGGQTALELGGYGHFGYREQKTVHLYTDHRLSSWLGKLQGMPGFVIHNRARLLPPPPDYTGLLSLEEEDTPRLPDDLEVEQWGHWNWPLVRSTPERAILEFLDNLPGSASFDMADKIMEGLVNLRPRRMQALLEDCGSIKVKRLFFFFASRHQLQWLGMIDRSGIDLGSGKRVIAKDGRLDKVWQITVPESMDAV